MPFDVVLILFLYTAVAVVVVYKVTRNGIDQAGQGDFRNHLVGSHQPRKDILYEVFRVAAATKTATDKGQ